MVITKIQGGVGNQMFQYAFGRYLSSKNKCELKLDISFFETQELRRFSLSSFFINADIATTKDCERLKNGKFKGFDRIKYKLIKLPPVLVREESLVFDPKYLNAGKYSYVDGYWQSENYFEAIASKIRKEFHVKSKPSVANSNMIDQISSTNAISLHVRRGDYGHDAINKIHGTCSLDYYKEAINLMTVKVGNPVFYIFSDDIPWAKKHLDLKQQACFVDINNGDSAPDDLRLMQTCKHHIIANSTFSWWGAWLNPKPNKIVIAPKQWFNDPELSLQTQTIIPSTWLSI